MKKRTLLTFLLVLSIGFSSILFSSLISRSLAQDIFDFIAEYGGYGLKEDGVTLGTAEANMTFSSGVGWGSVTLGEDEYEVTVSLKNTIENDGLVSHIYEGDVSGGEGPIRLAVYKDVMVGEIEVSGITYAFNVAQSLVSAINELDQYIEHLEIIALQQGLIEPPPFRDIYYPDNTIPTSIEVAPRTLIVSAKGKWITAYIELPDGYDVRDIDINTVMLNDIVPAVNDSKYRFVRDTETRIGDHDDDGVPDCMVKFDKGSVCNALNYCEINGKTACEVVITGSVAGSPFYGKDWIRVIGGTCLSTTSVNRPLRESDLFRNQEENIDNTFLSNAIATSSESIRVINVYAAADQEYKDHYDDWWDPWDNDQWEVEIAKAIEMGDDEFENQFNIDFRTNEIGTWDSNENSDGKAFDLFWEARKEVQKGDNHVRVVFTGLSMGGTPGLASEDIVLVRRIGDGMKDNLHQHEYSHLFGAKDNECDPGSICIMTYGYAWSYNSWCNTCSSIINNNKWKDFDGNIVELGHIEGMIGGGHFTTSADVPSGIYFSYGYSDETWSNINPVYVFDQFIISEAGITADLFQNDDPQFDEIVNALKNGPPPNMAFYTALGFSPSPPFHIRGVYMDSSAIPVPPGATIEFLRLILNPFTISSSPAPGGETLWEVPLTPLRVSAFGYE